MVVKLLPDAPASDEVVLSPDENRLAVFPIKHFEVWDAYKRQLAAFWTVEEIDFSKDYDDFVQLSENEKYFVKMVLAFFAASDTIVNINLGERFSREVQMREAIITYQFQMMMENIHSECYSLQIDSIIRDDDEKMNLFNALEHYPCVARKAEWAAKWIASDAPFHQRLLAFAIVEGIFFSGSFCAIFWLKKRNVMPGLTSSNELINRDEGAHCDFAVLLYTMLHDRMTEGELHEMMREAVDVETEFICESIPCSMLGMNQALMSQYIRFVADRLLLQLGYNKIWGAANPFDFMESISMEGKTNFFESRPTQYQKPAVLNVTKSMDWKAGEDF